MRSSRQKPNVSQVNLFCSNESYFANFCVAFQLLHWIIYNAQVAAILDMMLSDPVASKTIPMNAYTFEIAYYINGKDYIFPPLPPRGPHRRLPGNQKRPLNISSEVMETFTRVQEHWACVLRLCYDRDQVIYHHWSTEYWKIKGWQKEAGTPRLS